MLQVDPYSYLDRLTMPKYIICASGDEFFLPDSFQFYYASLRSPKYLRYVQNSGHMLDATQNNVASSIILFYRSIVERFTLPDIIWVIDPNPRLGTVVLFAQDHISPWILKGANMWQAYNSTARDFRKYLGIEWSGSALSPHSAGLFVAQPELPTEGWKAFFIEVVYERNNELMSFSSGVSIIPDILPYPPCGKECSCKDNCLLSPPPVNNDYSFPISKLTHSPVFYGIFASLILGMLVTAGSAVLFGIIRWKSKEVPQMGYGHLQETSK